MELSILCPTEFKIIPKTYIRTDYLNRYLREKKNVFNASV